MSDVIIPAEFVGGAAVAVTSIIGALWRQWSTDRRDAARHLFAVEEAAQERLEHSAERISDLEAQNAELQERWAKEVRRGARLAMMDTTRGPPSSLPRPEWEERTAVRDLRQKLESEALSDALTRYLQESTPPNLRPSRPKG